MLISGKVHSCRPNHTADLEKEGNFVYISLNVQSVKRSTFNKVTFPNESHVRG